MNKAMGRVSMDIRVERRSNRVLVHCSGKLDAEGAAHLKGAVEPLIGEMAVNDSEMPVILEMQGVTELSPEGGYALAEMAGAAGGGSAGESGWSVPMLRVAHLSEHLWKTMVRDEYLRKHPDLWASLAGQFAEKKPEEKQKEVLDRIRLAFPVPVSDPVHDAYFVQTVAKALDGMDKLKTSRPYLGERKPLDYGKARQVSIPDGMSTIEETVTELTGYLNGLTIWGHPLAQENVVPPASIPSIVAQIVASTYNPNIIWDEYSHRVAEAEVEASAMCASLVGYDPETSAGISTWGGTATIFYGIKLGLEKALPGSFREGVRQDAKILVSEVGHYAKISALGWLGIGTKNLVSIPSDRDNSMDLDALENSLRLLIEDRIPIAGIIATMGSTDAFGLDNLAAIVRLRDALVAEYCLEYRPHIHADAVIGWAWSVFNDYDFSANPMGFPQRTLRSLWDARSIIRHLGKADSVGIDFHKTGYAPYLSSLFLCKAQKDLNLISRDTESMPYLFQFGNYHPGIFTMETSRAGGSVLGALANLKHFGKEGFRALLGHIVSMAEYLRSRLEEGVHTRVVNDYNNGPVTLFRVYPEGVEAQEAYRREAWDPDAGEQLKAHNDYNRRIFDALHRQMEEGRGLALSITDHYRTAMCGGSILALKSFVMSPFVDEEAMDRLTGCIEEARREVEI
jgi:L-2,4-diaminobutyrate decarboxylase